MNVEFKGLRDQEDIIIDNMMQNMKTFQTIGPVTCFGELALTNNILYTTSAISKNEAVVAYIHQETLQEIIQNKYSGNVELIDRFYDQKLSYYYRILQKVAELDKVDKEDLGILIYLIIDQKTYGMNQLIYKQNDQPDYIYIIINGEVTMNYVENEQKA